MHVANIKRIIRLVPLAGLVQPNHHLGALRKGGSRSRSPDGHPSDAVEHRVPAMVLEEPWQSLGMSKGGELAPAIAAGICEPP